jgi:hypothetical protein
MSATTPIVSPAAAPATAQSPAPFFGDGKICEGAIAGLPAPADKPLAADESAPAAKAAANGPLAP